LKGGGGLLEGLSLSKKEGLGRHKRGYTSEISRAFYGQKKRSGVGGLAPKEGVGKKCAWKHGCGTVSLTIKRAAKKEKVRLSFTKKG